MPTENNPAEPLPEVKRWQLKGFIPGVEGESEAVFRPVVVLASDFDAVTRCFLDAAERCLAAERREQALQLRLNAADQRIDELTGTSADRSPKDYAIEHAEYMAKSADHVFAEFQAYGFALIAVDEGGDDGEGELFEVIDSARQDLQEALVDLRSTVFEFRKRANRIASL
jgi:hypothetical protein